VKWGKKNQRRKKKYGRKVWRERERERMINI
jgi:hypothetical protein